MRSAPFRTSRARRVMSPMWPMGVATAYSVPRSRIPRSTPLPEPAERLRIFFGVRARYFIGFEDPQEGPHDVGIELRARTALDLRDDLLFGAGGTVRPGRGHGLVGVDEGHDPGADRDLLAFQARGVAGPVPAFLVVEQDGHERREELDVRHHVSGDPGMALDLLVLLGSELARLFQDGLRHADLPHAVDHGRELHEAHDEI